ncbi:hypothetical protein NDU88_001189 [Pleurodeles waltl]|uniref:Uncharacterized protein n=1 Tax=Pleurodeles waltl TaxID=8319 RepID=A0AAV7NA75_PLEWA|nr:hypothetical protein NDU88_001189 [Pleurodeles waltl]
MQHPARPPQRRERQTETLNEEEDDGSGERGAEMPTPGRTVEKSCRRIPLHATVSATSLDGRDFRRVISQYGVIVRNTRIIICLISNYVYVC